MPTSLLFPTIGTSVRGTLSSWVPEDGAMVSAGDLLYYVEYGNQIEEISSPVAGRLHATGSPGMTYTAGDVIGSIE